jgi:hypothetical protein
MGEVVAGRKAGLRSGVVGCKLWRLRFVRWQLWRSGSVVIVVVTHCGLNRSSNEYLHARVTEEGLSCTLDMRRLCRDMRYSMGERLMYCPRSRRHDGLRLPAAAVRH